MAATASTSSVTEICRAARRAARGLAALPTDAKDAALSALADALEARVDEVLEANARDLEAGTELTDALRDRLRLTPERVAAIAAQVRDVAALRDPVGEVVEGFRLPNGLDVTKVRVPLGVVAVVYEARPNVTIDATALAFKAGCAIVLRGSSTAGHSNAVLARIARDCLPEGAVSLVAGGGRAELTELATQDGLVDLIIPRGGDGLKAALQAVATVPVIYAASGNCHVYVDASADLDVAERIVVNAKTQRPGVCNAAESLLVHRDVAAELLPRLAAAMPEVELRADDAARQHLPSAAPASDEDFGTEFLALVLSVAVVDGVDEAVEWIARHGSGHSEAIVTRDAGAARAFELGVDAACVYVNASTRFTDGGELGMGAEVGNSTQKLHARGPIGMRELCSYKYVVRGDGHVRA